MRTVLAKDRSANSSDRVQNPLQDSAARSSGAPQSFLPHHAAVPHHWKWYRNDHLQHLLTMPDWIRLYIPYASMINLIYYENIVAIIFALKHHNLK